MEKPTKIIYLFFQIATIVLLVIGLGKTQIWQGVIIILILVPFLWIAHRLQWKIYPSIKLVIFVGIAAYGLLRNAASYLMIAGVSTALACWELEDMHPKPKKTPISSVTSSCEKYHLKILSMATAAGLIIAETGLFVKITLQFSVVLLVAILVLFCIIQLFVLFKRNNSSRSE